MMPINRAIRIYRTVRPCVVRRQMSLFGQEQCRLKAGVEFAGQPTYDPAWVSRILGGFVSRSRVIEARRVQRTAPA